MTFRRPLVFSPSDHFYSQSISLFLKTGSRPDVRVPDPRPSRGGDSASTPAPACEGGSAEAPAEARKTRGPPPPPRAPAPPITHRKAEGGRLAGTGCGARCSWLGARRGGRGEGGAAGPLSLGETEARTSKAPRSRRFPASPIFSHPKWGGGLRGGDGGWGGGWREASRSPISSRIFLSLCLSCCTEKGGYAYYLGGVRFAVMHIICNHSKVIFFHLGLLV